MKIQFKTRKETSSFLKEKGIDTSNWTEEKWLSINKGQAEIHMMDLAEAMYDCINEAEVQELKDGEWHIPFDNIVDLSKIVSKAQEDFNQQECTEIEFHNKVIDYKIKISTARCARTSYTTVGNEKEFSIESDIKLHDTLTENGHASPMEHIARCMTESEYESFYKGVGANKNHTGIKENQGWCNNFKGFISYRYLLENKKF